MLATASPSYWRTGGPKGTSSASPPLEVRHSALDVRRFFDLPAPAHPLSLYWTLSVGRSALGVERLLLPFALSPLLFLISAVSFSAFQRFPSLLLFALWSDRWPLSFSAS